MNVHARSVVSDSLWPHELHVACQFPLFNGFSRQEYWSGLPFLLQGIFLTQGLTPWTVACQAPLSMEFSRQEYWSGLSFLSPGNLFNPGIGPRSPALQANSLLSEPPGKPSVRMKWRKSRSVVSDSLQPHGLYSPWNSPGQNTGVGSLSLLQEIFPTQGSNPGLSHCRQILYQLSHKGSLRI